MTKQDGETREKIMEATIELIKKYGDVTMITVREIAANVGAGVGLINYHFQTKDNLINQCILRMIGHTINQFQTMNQNSEMRAIDKLRDLTKGIAAFMVTNPGISRISIINDFVGPRADDNSAQVARMCFPVLKEMYGAQKTDQELFVLLHILITSIQALFLRREVIKETIGMDFSNAGQRDTFIDSCIQGIFPGFS